VPAEQVECPIGNGCTRGKECWYYHSRRGSGRKRGPVDGDVRYEARERDDWRYVEDGLKVYERESEAVKRCCYDWACRGGCGRLHDTDRDYIPSSQVRCRFSYDKCDYAQKSRCTFYHSDERRRRTKHSSRSDDRDERSTTRGSRTHSEERDAKRVKVEIEHQYEASSFRSSALAPTPNSAGSGSPDGRFIDRNAPRCK